MLALAAGHFPHRFSNPGFRNVRTPMATAASRDKPYLSVPIVLMPDGKIVPKAGQISYQYLPQDGQNNQRGSKARDLPSNYQVVAPPSSYSPQPKQKKSGRNSMPGTGSRRPNTANAPKNNNVQPQQQYQNSKYMQQPDLHSMPVSQRNPITQQQIISSQPNNDLYKQSVLNFLNFASHLGSQVVSQQQNTQKNQLQSTDVMYGTPESPKSYENYVVQGPVPTNDAQTGINMYLQSPTQGNSNQQIQQQASQSTGYNMPQAQNLQATSAQSNFQYGHSRPQVQAGQQQSSVQNQASVFQQNLGTTVQFPEAQKNTVQANSYFQATQQTLPKNYLMVSTPQESASNTRSLNNVNFDPQMLKSIFNTQAQIETPNYSTNAQSKPQNYINPNQESQTYITTDGQHISFANSAQPSPVTYSTQQNLQQHIVNQNTSPTVQASYSQPGEQKVYYSYQNPQDLSTNYASSSNQPQSNAASQVGHQTDQTQYRSLQAQSQSNVYSGSSSGQNSGQQVAYRVQPHLESQQAELATYTYGQPSYLSVGPKQDSSSGGGGKLIYASSSAKQIHYSPSGQGHSNSQLKNNEETPSYAQFSESSSSYKLPEDEDDSEYKPSSSGQLTDKQVKGDSDEESDDGEEDTSYKVVYIPLDILKGILNSNNVDNRLSDKTS